MATFYAVTANKVKGVWEWRLRGHRWTFTEWPNEQLARDGVVFGTAALYSGVKLVSEAVLFSLGYEMGSDKGRGETLDQVLEGMRK